MTRPVLRKANGDEHRSQRALGATIPVARPIFRGPVCNNPARAPGEEGFEPALCVSIELTEGRKIVALEAYDDQMRGLLFHAPSLGSVCRVLGRRGCVLVGMIRDAS